METKIQRWGNSLGVRIPRSMAIDAQVEAGSTVDVTLRDGALVLRPVRPKLDARDLVKAITARNMHDAIDMGDTTGREVW
jgi:antitoxin MazE